MLICGMTSDRQTHRHTEREKRRHFGMFLTSQVQTTAEIILHHDLISLGDCTTSRLIYAGAVVYDNVNYYTGTVT